MASRQVTAAGLDDGVGAAAAGPLDAAVAAYLGRFKGVSRAHTESDLRVFIAWCSQHHLDPLHVQRQHLERYVRWMQEVRRFQPSTVGRRLSVVCGFYRTAVLDGVLELSPAEHVRRPRVPAESPTLGLGHLQFEALLTAARLSPNTNDFALVAMLGLLGLRIVEATSANITDLTEEHATASSASTARATKPSWSRCHPPSAEPSTTPSTTTPTDQSCATAAAPAWTATPPPADSATSPPPPASACPACAV